MTPVRLKAAGEVSLEQRLLWYERARLLFTVMSFLILGGIVVYLFVDSGRANTDRAKLGDVAERVLSCTERGKPEPGKPPSKWATPPGKCYIESQRAQSQVVGEPAGGINTVVVAAAACASTLPPELSREDAQRLTLACTRASLVEVNGAAP